MKTLFAVTFALVAALMLSPAPAWSNGFRGHTPTAHWATWGKPAHGHSHHRFRDHGQFKHGHFHKPVFVVPRAVIAVPQIPVFVAPRRAWVPGFHAWTGHYWVWVPGHWR